MIIIPIRRCFWVCLLSLLSAPSLHSDDDLDEKCSLDNHETCSSSVDDTNSRATDDFFFDEHDVDHASSLWSREIRREADSTPEKWAKFNRLIDNAVKAYIPCDLSTGSRTCFSDVIVSDLARFRSSEGVTREMTEGALPYGVLYQIIGHQLYRQKECMFPSRCAGVEHFLLDLCRRKILPDMEFVLNVRDYPQVSALERHPFPVFSFSKTDDFQDILYPAWTFWQGGPAIASHPRGLGRWDLMRDRIDESADRFPWEKKQAIGFFRGSRTSADRDPLIMLSRNHPELIDAKYTKNQAWHSNDDTLGEDPAVEVPLEDHCRFKYLFNFRGIAASFRFKHLFLCESVVFHVDSEWMEFFYPAMKPWVHYIPVRRDLSDARELLEFAKENDSLVRLIAIRGKEFIFRHLKMTDVESYWKELLTEYASLLNYTIKKRSNLVEIPPSVS